MKRLIERWKLHKAPIIYWREKGAQIGENCEIYSSASFGSEPYLIKIGNHVRINSGVSFVTHDGGVWVLRKLLKDERLDLFGVICVGDNVHIGTNTIILPGVKIGNNCIIGCGAVVTKDIPDNSVACGVPARVIESIDEYVCKHRNDLEYTKMMMPDKKKEYLLKKYNELEI